MDAAAYRDFVLEIVRRTDKEPGFKVLHKRWAVERTFYSATAPIGAASGGLAPS